MILQDNTKPISHWKSTDKFDYATIFANNNVTISFKPKSPCVAVTLTFEEINQPSRTVPMTYRDQIWSFLIGNVDEKDAGKLKYKFTYNLQQGNDTEYYHGTT